MEMSNVANFYAGSQRSCGRDQAKLQTRVMHSLLRTIFVSQMLKAKIYDIILPNLSSVLANPGEFGFVLNKTGLVPQNLKSIFLAGYAGELCVFEADKVKSRSELFVHARNSIVDTREIATLLNENAEIITKENVEDYMHSHLEGEEYRSYDLLNTRILECREMVSEMYSEWQNKGFIHMAVLGR